MVSRQKGVGAEGERNYNTMMPSTQADVPQQSARKRKGSTRSTRSGEQGSDHDQVQDSPGQWKKWAEKYGSIELENKGSVARDHLALGMSIRLAKVVLGKSFWPHVLLPC